MTTNNPDTAHPGEELVSHDFTQQTDEPLPAVFTRVGRVVQWKETPNYSEVGVLLEPEANTQRGQFLGVYHGRRKQSRLTIVQVNDCLEVNPNEEATLSAARRALGLSPGYVGEGLSTRIFRLAACETIEELDIKSFDPWVLGETQSPNSLVRTGDPVVTVPADIVASTIGSLPSPDDGLSLGKTYGPDSTDFTLKPQALQMHMGIFGNPGTGKSYGGGVILEEAHQWGVPIMVIDLNGEMVDVAKALDGLVITLPDPNNFGLSLNNITPPELVSITPNVQPGTQYSELIEIAHDQLRGEAAGKPISFTTLIERITQLGTALDVKASSVKAAVSRLGALSRDPLIGKTFDFIEKLKRHKFITLDCRLLSLRQTQLIAAAAARVLQGYGREMTKYANENRDADAAKWFALLFIDEAHTVVPNGENVVSTQVVYELARMGRHVRTGLILSSQSPSDLDTSVLKRLQTRFIFALEKDQLRSIVGVTADLNEKILRQLPKLPRGVCAVSGSSELVKHGFLLQIKRRRTPVGGKTPPVFSGRNKQPLKTNE